MNLNEEFLDDLNKSIAIAGNFVYLTNVSFQEFYNVGFRLLEYREKNTCPFCLTKKDMDNLNRDVNEESNRLLNNEKLCDFLKDY